MREKENSMDTNNMQRENNSAPMIPPEYAPISMWGYFGYEVLFSIPFIGFIVLVCLAIGAKNVNLKNFARSYFCLFIIGLIILAVIAALLLISGVGLEAIRTLDV